MEDLKQQEDLKLHELTDEMILRFRTEMLVVNDKNRWLYNDCFYALGQSISGLPVHARTQDDSRRSVLNAINAQRRALDPPHAVTILGR